jgi:hypothetical protein
MLIHWLRADWAFHHGGDPEPALDLALADAGHTTFLGRDYLGDVLNLKAQVEAAQGRDPRHVLDRAMACMAPALDQGCAAPRSLCATAARTWTLLGDWEAAHGLDPRPSLARARALAERARGAQTERVAAVRRRAGRRRKHPGRLAG